MDPMAGNLTAERTRSSFNLPGLALSVTAGEREGRLVEGATTPSRTPEGKQARDIGHVTLRAMKHD